MAESRRRKRPAAKVPRRLEAMEDAIDVAILRYRMATMTMTYTIEEVRRNLDKPAKRRGVGRRVR